MAVEFDKAFVSNAGETRDVESTAVGLTDIGFEADDVNRATAMVATAYDQDVLWTCDGSDPVVSGDGGHLLVANAELVLRGRTNILNFKVIATTGTATLFVTLFNPDPAG